MEKLGHTGTVLSLFDYTTNMVKPWAEVGYHCICVDNKHTEKTTIEHGGGWITKVPADITNYIPPLREYDIVFAFPPCTNLAVSGARWFKDKGLEGLREGLDLVLRAEKICKASGNKWMIENPVSTLSTYWRKPDYRFDPCDYAGYATNPEEEAYTKKTCLWTGSRFNMPEKNRVEPNQGSKMHRLPPTEDRNEKRSVTPNGFARAVFQYNVPS